MFGGQGAQWRGDGDKPFLDGGGQDYQVGLEHGDGCDERADGCVWPEEGNAPAVAGHNDAEADQADVVAFAGGAGEECPGPASAVPVSGQREESLADKLAGEVFLGNGHVAAGPRVTDGTKAGQ